MIEFADLSIRYAEALANRLSPPQGKTMTATEVLERSSENALLLAATYGRLQAELLTPLLERVFAILIRRGIVPHFDVDGETIALDIRSPMASVQIQRSVQATLSWFEAASRLGPDAMAIIDKPKIIARIAAELGIDSTLIQSPEITTTEGATA